MSFRERDSKESKKLLFSILQKVQEDFASVLTSEVPDSTGLKAKDITPEFFLKLI